MGEGGAHRADGAEEHVLEHPGPDGVRDRHRLVSRHPRHHRDAVEPAERADGFLHQLVDRALVADVDGHRVRGPAAVGERRDGVLGAVAVTPGQHERCALGREYLRGGEPYARGPADHDDSLAAYPEVHVLPLCRNI